jgi:hypothetical protein
MNVLFRYMSNVNVHNGLCNVMFFRIYHGTVLNVKNIMPHLLNSISLVKWLHDKWIPYMLDLRNAASSACGENYRYYLLNSEHSLWDLINSQYKVVIITIFCYHSIEIQTTPKDGADNVPQKRFKQLCLWQYNRQSDQKNVLA